MTLFAMSQGVDKFGSWKLNKIMMILEKSFIRGSVHFLFIFQSVVSVSAWVHGRIAVVSSHACTSMQW